MKAKWDGQINPHELPPVPCMVHKTYTEGYEFIETMLASLRARAPMDISAQWALEMIAELQHCWFMEGDVICAIERIIRGEPGPQSGKET